MSTHRTYEPPGSDSERFPLGVPLGRSTKLQLPAIPGRPNWFLKNGAPVYVEPDPPVAIVAGDSSA